MRRRPTRRGWVLLAAGVVALQVGIGLGSVDLVRLALVLVALPAGALLALWVGDVLHDRRGLHVHREVRPDPVHVDERAVPTSSRPPDKMSRAAARSATRTGWFISGTQTTAPWATRMRSVRAATAVRNSSGAEQWL